MSKKGIFLATYTFFYYQLMFCELEMIKKNNFKVEKPVLCKRQLMFLCQQFLHIHEKNVSMLFDWWYNFTKYNYSVSAF